MAKQLAILNPEPVRLPGPELLHELVGQSQHGAAVAIEHCAQNGTIERLSYADLEMRDALETLDAQGVRNTAETRRQIRFGIQKEVIQCNGEIVKDFGEVAEVC